MDDQIKDSEVGGAQEMYVGEEMCLQGLVGQPEEKKPFRRPGHRWENITKMNQ